MEESYYDTKTIQYAISKGTEEEGPFQRIYALKDDGSVWVTEGIFEYPVNPDWQKVKVEVLEDLNDVLHKLSG